MPNKPCEIQREVLPIPDNPAVGSLTYDAADPDTRYPAITPLRPPRGAPNVLIILLDDVGFGASSAFGGPCHTPTAQRLAQDGLRYTRFHTTALCAPTRQALLTGRNHHSVGMGAITEMATSAPGNSSIRPRAKAPLAEILLLNGYSTAHFGKCHEVPVWETSPMGPFHQWPTGSGFEHFYGFVGGEANQYYPGLFEGTRAVKPPRTPEEGYTLNEDLADRAITWVRQQRVLMPDKPFFIYYAPGATHAPHHVPAEWSNRYFGKFDAGWDRLRQDTFMRQKQLGVVPVDAELTARPREIPAWSEMPAELRPVLIRQMEIYAGFLEQTDHHVGRLVDAIEDLGALDDTLVFYILGDNGASAEGTLNGCFNEMTRLNGMEAIETTEFLLGHMDDLGTPRAYNHYAVGWAHALCTPYQWAKQAASHWGGTRTGTVVHWPGGIRAAGQLRHQFHHVIDVVPTVLEVAGLPPPAYVHGVAQAPHEGCSMAASFDRPDAPETHDLQYFEIFGNRAIYHRGWTAGTRHSSPLDTDDPPPFEADVWELYGPGDWTQARDLAADEPARLAALQRLWLMEAVRYGVVPLDDRRLPRLDPAAAGRPCLIHGTRQLLFCGMRLNEHSVINTRNRTHTVTVQVTVPHGPVARGVLAAQGGSAGGWSLYAHEGKLKYCYNFFGIEHYFAESEGPVPPGEHQLRMQFRYDGGGVAKGAHVTLYVNDELVGSGRVARSIPLGFSADEACDVGCDTGSPTSPDYGARDNDFNGRVAWVQIEVGDDDGPVSSPSERYRMALAKQ